MFIGRGGLCATYLFFQGRDELLVAGQHVGTVLNERAECPESEGWLAVFLYDIQVRVIYAAAHLASLLDHGVDALGEGVVEGFECSLQVICRISF